MVPEDGDKGLFEAWTNTLFFSMQPVQDIASAWFECSYGRSDEE